MIRRSLKYVSKGFLETDFMVLCSSKPEGHKEHHESVDWRQIVFDKDY